MQATDGNEKEWQERREGKRIKLRIWSHISFSSRPERQEEKTVSEQITGESFQEFIDVVSEVIRMPVHRITSTEVHIYRCVKTGNGPIE